MSITELSLVSRSEVKYLLNLGINVSPITIKDRTQALDVHDGFISASWLHNGEEILFTPKLSDKKYSTLIAYPSPCMNYVFVTYPNAEYNQVTEIISATGNRHMSIDIPKRLTPSRERVDDQAELKGPEALMWLESKHHMGVCYRLKGSDFIECRYFNLKSFEYEPNKYQLQGWG